MFASIAEVCSSRIQKGSFRMLKGRALILFLWLFQLCACHGAGATSSEREVVVDYIQETEGSLSSTEFIDSIVSALVGAKDVISRAYTSYKEGAALKKDKLESGISWFQQLQVSIDMISAQIPYIQKVHAENLVSDEQRKRQQDLLIDLDSFLKELQDHIPRYDDRGVVYRTFKNFFADEVQLEKMYRLVKAYEKGIMLWLTKAGYTALVRTSEAHAEETQSTLRVIAESSSKKTREEEVDEAALDALKGMHDMAEQNSDNCYNGFPWQQSSIKIRIDRWKFIQEHITYLPETVQQRLRDASWTVEDLKSDINPFSKVLLDVIRMENPRYLKECKRGGVDITKEWNPRKVADYARCLDYLSKRLGILKDPSCFGEGGERGSLEEIITTLGSELLALNEYGYDHLAEVSQYDIVGLQWVALMSSMKTGRAIHRDVIAEVKAIEKGLAKSIMGREGGMLEWYNTIWEEMGGYVDGLPANIVMMS